jgi:hypothetical protein
MSCSLRHPESFDDTKIRMRLSSPYIVYSDTKKAYMILVRKYIEINNGSYRNRPSKLSQAATVLACIREVLVSTLTEGFRGFPQSLQANAGRVPSNMPRSRNSTRFQIHHPVINLAFDAVKS